uniref:Uncharacterized protein n=1 Tax=Lepeophtheirus salmonis TaxID=72036 RepID=A0A0K2TW84_LEPSM
MLNDLAVEFNNIFLGISSFKHGNIQENFHHRSSKGTIENAIRIDLHFLSRVRASKHLLTEQNKTNRMSKGKILIKQMKSKGSYARFFFPDAKHKRRNDKWICLDPDEVQPVMKTKNPASVMVLGVISTEGQVMPPFFQNDQNLTNEVNKDVLKDMVILCMNEVTDGKPYTFQQDSAPVHRVKNFQEVLEQNVPDFGPPFYWAANSPELNPFGFTCEAW